MDRDNELDHLLSKLRQLKPNHRQTATWTAAVQKEMSIAKVRGRWAQVATWAAILATGYFLGFYSSRFLSPDEHHGEIVATTQYVFSNSN